MFFMPPRRARAGRFAGGWRDNAVRSPTASWTIAEEAKQDKCPDVYPFHADWLGTSMRKIEKLSYFPHVDRRKIAAI
jgi:hypothetical protein